MVAVLTLGLAPMRRRRALVAAALTALALSGCATPGAVLTESVGTIRDGVGAVRVQSTEAFEAANRSAIDIDVERVVARPTPQLTEADFPRAIDPADIEKWSNAFNGLDAYLGAVQSLVDPARATATADNLDKVAEQLRGGATGLKLPAEASGAFSALAGALVQARADRTATAVIRRTDVAFNEVTTTMAGAIGNDGNSGLRQTVRLYWLGKLSDVRANFATAATTDEARRRELAGQFAGAMTSRDADLANLGSLHDSLLALGQAHSAAARGSGGDAVFWVGRITDWLADVKRRVEAAKAGEGK